MWKWIILRVALVVGVSAIAAGSSLAWAKQSLYVQCGLESADTGMILTADSTLNQTLINRDAVFCDSLIATGRWFGVDKKAIGLIRAAFRFAQAG
jgi:hypothetical protein